MVGIRIFFSENKYIRLANCIVVSLIFWGRTGHIWCCNFTYNAPRYKTSYPNNQISTHRLTTLAILFQNAGEVYRVTLLDDLYHPVYSLSWAKFIW